MNIGFAMCGSFCTFSEVFPVMEELAEAHRLIPIFSANAYTIDSRFGTAQSHIRRAIYAEPAKYAAQTRCTPLRM